MRITLLLLVALVSVTMPAQAQPLTKSECDEVVIGSHRALASSCGAACPRREHECLPSAGRRRDGEYGSAAP